MFFEVNDVNERSAFKECIIFHYWYLLDKRFKFELTVCSECYDVLIYLLTLQY